MYTRFPRRRECNGDGRSNLMDRPSMYVTMDTYSEHVLANIHLFYGEYLM